jgi:membrane associated rhomboid family serine protease
MQRLLNSCVSFGLKTFMVITYIILAVTVAASFYAWDKRIAFANMMMNPYRISHYREYYRFITSGFIHNDHTHLVVNMISFYFFGLAVESVFSSIFGAGGRWYFLALYLLGVLVSDLPTFVKHRNNPAYNSLGASGAVSAVVFAFIIFKPLENILLFFILPVPGFILGTLYIIFSWHQGRRSNDNINHDAHLYGALFGLVFCIIVYPASLPEFFEQVKNWRMFDNL